MLVIDNDYHMLNLLGMDHASNTVIQRFKHKDLNELFKSYRGGSLTYFNPKYPESEFSGMYGFNGSKGLEITIKDSMCLRDSEKGFQYGCWIGYDNHDFLDKGIWHRKVWSRVEAEKLFKTSNQISLF